MASPSHLNPPAPIDRPNSRVSLARSDTTYHSFQDLELFEPEPSPCQPDHQPSTIHPPQPVTPSETKEQRPPTREMRRQDSGYESIAPRDSMCSGRQTSSSASVSSPTSSRPKKRPHRHRRPRPGRNGRHSLSPPRITTTTFGSGHHQQPTPVTYFHFPLFTSSDPALYEADLPQPLALPSPSECPPAAARSNTTNTYYSFYPYPTRSETSSPSPLPSPTTVLGAGTGTSPSTYPYPPPLPPQTTHYWTSDRTRRLEYAAIDAASKGVRGWIVRHVVPDCFVPRSRRRLGFDDDRGSVVRYRLELEESSSSSSSEGGVDSSGAGEKKEAAESGGRPARWWRSWWFSVLRR